MNDQELKDWLNQAPDLISDNPDGSKFVDISIVEKQLDEGYPGWGTENFKFRLFDMGGQWFASSSIEVLLGNRRLVGAATIKIEVAYGEAPNVQHIEPTMVSESIKNGCKRLGPKFGRDLNDRGTQQEAKPSPSKKTPRSKMTGVKMQPDASVLKLYEAAIASGDLNKINVLLNTYNIKTAEDYAS